MNSKANVGKVTLLLAALMLVLALVVGVGVVAAADGPQDAQPPVVCGHGWALLKADVFQANFNHVAPCAWVVRFDSVGKWALESDSELAITKSFHYPLCKVTATGFVKARPGCAIVVRAAADTPEGKSWRFRLTQADPVPPALR